jgi:hypothetical protein
MKKTAEGALRIKKMLQKKRERARENLQAENKSYVQEN